jgi:hypothetical protein
MVDLCVFGHQILRRFNPPSGLDHENLGGVYLPDHSACGRLLVDAICGGRGLAVGCIWWCPPWRASVRESGPSCFPCAAWGMLFADAYLRIRTSYVRDCGARGRSWGVHLRWW